MKNGGLVMGVTGSGFRVMQGLGLCCLLGLGVARALQAETTGTATRIRVELTDGSSLIGQSGIETVAVRTDYAVLSIPLAAIKILTKDSRSPGVVVSALNGDRITGELDIGKWPVTTAVGPLVLDPALIRQVTPVGERATEARGLVLWNGLGSAEEVRNSFVGPSGTLHGNLVFKPGKRGDGMSVNGAGGVQFPPASLRGLDQPTTIECWVRIPSAVDVQKMVMWCCHAPNGAGLYVLLAPDRRLKFQIGNSSGDTFVEPLFISAPLNEGDWHHVAVTWDMVNTIDGTDTVRVYLDGTIAFRTSARGRNPPNPFRNAGSHLNFMIGCQGYGGRIDGDVYDGTLDELRVWDHVITDFSDVIPR